MDGNIYIALGDDEQYVHERVDKMVKENCTFFFCKRTARK